MIDKLDYITYYMHGINDSGEVDDKIPCKRAPTNKEIMDKINEIIDAVNWLKSKEEWNGYNI